MKKCDNCKKKTKELYFYQAKLPNFIIKENRMPETPNEHIEAMSKNRISIIDMWICAECLKKREADLTELYTKMLGHQAKISREWFEERKDVEDLK